MDIEQRLQKIEERNVRVEAEKAWETSVFRVGLIMLVTYVVACGVLFVIGNSNPFRNALIPALGYLLSTQSLPFIKRFWINRHIVRRSK
ncbi:MAG: hypothetical protein Q7S26_02440 [bacterium]|nr:hypothetical protein [bacterium]